MWKNYLMLAIRNFSRHKLFSLLNIIGLAIGITGSFLIYLNLQKELSYDKHFENSENIYRAGVAYDIGGNIDRFSNVPRPIGPTMYEDYAQIRAFTRILGVPNLLSHEAMIDYQNNKIYTDQIFYADSSFFEVFKHHFIQGQPSKALVRPNTIILTEQLAQNIFGAADPMGKLVKVDDGALMEITGVIKNSIGSTHLPFEALMSWATIASERDNTQWIGRHVYTYFLLERGTDPNGLIQQFGDFFGKYMEETFKTMEAKCELILQPLESIHLHSDLKWEAYPNGSITNVYIFAAIAFFLLLIAIINYTNLSTVRSLERNKEVGIRKVIGASRSNLILMYLLESIVITLLSLFLVFILAIWLLPTFNQLTNQDLTFGKLFQLKHLVVLFGIALFVGILSGIYPAFFLSRFKPVDTLKTNIINGSSKNLIRKSLVVLQYLIAICLIISTIIVSSQVEYLRNHPLGFDQENIMMIDLKDTTIIQNIEAIKQDFQSYPNILSVATATGVPGLELNQTAINVQNTQGENSNVGVQFLEIDYDFIPFMGMNLLEGRNFSRNHPTDINSGIIVNQTAAKRFGWGDKILGQKINFGPNPDGSIDDISVIGVVSDFHTNSLHNAHSPVILFLSNPPSGKLFLKLNGTDLSQSITKVEAKWSTLGNSSPLSYSFLDEHLKNQYLSEEKLLKLLQYFAWLTIIIASLGLFGIASFTIVRRKKEIGIRKILGSSVRDIFTLLSKEFIGMVLLANLIAWPLAWFGMSKWLTNYAFRIEMNWFPFLIAALLSFTIALLAISYQSLRTTFSNAADSLRYE